MKKTLTLLTVAVMTLTAFAGVASAEVDQHYWDVMTTNGWLDYGNLPGPNYVLYGKYVYKDHMIWKVYDGVTYLDAHENWHISWMTKMVENNGKPAVFIQYHLQYSTLFSPKHTKHHHTGRLHMVDPQASEDNTEVTENPWSGTWPIYGWGFWGMAPYLDVINDDRRGTPYPTTDTIPLIDTVFMSIDFAQIPLIDRIELWTPDGYYNVQMSIVE
jgi:hypothetical protein